jgi:cell division protein FtsQ
LPRQRRRGDRWQPGVRGNGPPWWRRRWTLRLLLAGTLLVFLALGGVWLYRSPFITVRKLEVVGAESLDPSAIQALADVRGENMFQLDVEDARQRILMLPRVKDVSLKRLWPNGVRITVEERHPWGWWQVGETRYVVDEEGVILDGSSPPEGSPIIVHLETQRQFQAGERVDPGAIELAGRLLDSAQRSFGRSVVGLEYRDRDGLTAILDGGLRATFGDARDYDYKVGTLYLLLETARQEQASVSSVDLRFGDRITFR